MRLSAPFGAVVSRRCPLWQQPLRLRMRYAGTHAVLTESDGGLIPITAPGGGVPAGGCEIAEPAVFAALTQAAPGSVLDTADWDQSRWHTVDLGIVPQHTDPDAAVLMVEALTEVLACTGPSTGRWRQHRLAADLIGRLHHDADLTVLLTSLVGAGPGATPSGDDLIVGIAAALAIAGQQQFLTQLSNAVAPLLGRTTSLSRHLIEAACAGEFGEYVHRIAGGLTDGSNVPAAARYAATVGAQSGLDTGLGAAYALGAM